MKNVTNVEITLSPIFLMFTITRKMYFLLCSQSHGATERAKEQRLVGGKPEFFNNNIKKSSQIAKRKQEDEQGQMAGRITGNQEKNPAKIIDNQ